MDELVELVHADNLVTVWSKLSIVHYVFQLDFAIMYPSNANLTKPY